MSGASLKELEMARYARLLRNAVGSDHPLALCDRESVVLWCTESASDARLRAAVARLEAEGFGWEVTGPTGGRCQLGDGDTLFYAPVCTEPEHEIGRLVLLAGGSDAASGRLHPRLAELLADVASCLSHEARLTTEVTGMAGELSERYEELNLVYSLDDHARSIDQGSAGMRALLQSFANFLSLDVVALIEPGRTAPLYATNLTQPMPNLDLVLTELRGDFFRFVSTSRRPLVMNDSTDARRQYILSNLPFKVIGVPVMGERSTGAMLVMLRHPERSDFTNGDRNLAQVIASQTAIMMRNRVMLKKMEQFSHQMANALIEAVEAKDPYTRGHSERVQVVSTGIGQGMKMADEKLEGLFWGALLHDIGKIGVPDAILCKAGPLSEDEYTFIKIHPERSFEIMRHIEYLNAEALDGARYHQERWDGKGYPHGLRGDEIPLHARVISVADTYDAITSSRSYRPGQSHEVAMSTIDRVAGSQLDPDIVRVFQNVVSRNPAWVASPTAHSSEADE